MIEQEVIIKNETGLHARPASQFVKKANTFKSKIEVIHNNTKVNAKSIMGILSLGVAKGNTIKIKTEGEDEDIAIKELTKLIKSFKD